MTWIIGANTPFGYGFVVSDVRVTFGNGEALDCVQKVYRVGDFIAAGFAGSVRIGFEMIEDLTKFLRDPDMEPDECWIPDWVTTEWAPRARRVFQEAPIVAREGGCSILMVGAHPTEDGINGARAYTSVLRSPDFAPMIWSDFDSVQSIGSGSTVREYRKLLGSSFDNQVNLIGELGGHGGMARLMVGGFMRRVFNNPTHDVSHHLQYVIIRRGRVEQHDFEPTRIQGNEEVRFRMPQLAHGWDEFCTLVTKQRGHGSSVDDATG